LLVSARPCWRSIIPASRRSVSARCLPRRRPPAINAWDAPPAASRPARGRRRRCPAQWKASRTFSMETARRRAALPARLSAADDLRSRSPLPAGAQAARPGRTRCRRVYTRCRAAGSLGSSVDAVLANGLHSPPALEPARRRAERRIGAASDHGAAAFGAPGIPST
jgi:hypothetical protein